MSQNPQLQTIGELVDRNGQRPERFGISLNQTPIPEARDELGALNDAIAHYEHIVAISAKPEVRVEALRRAADLRVDGVQRGLLVENQLPLALANYQRLLTDYPSYPNRAQVLYQQGRVQSMLNDDVAAIASLELVAGENGASPLAAKSQFRAAEMQLSRGDYAAAASAYSKVIDLPQAGEYRLFAQYKRAWALFEMSDYEQALKEIDAVLVDYVPVRGIENTATLRQGSSLVGLDRAGHGKGIYEDATRLAVLCLAASDLQQLERFLPPAKSPVLAQEIYSKLVAQLLDKERVANAAEVALHFAATRPDSAEAPAFHRRAIAAYLSGGLEAEAVAQKLAFVDRYDPGAAILSSGNVGESVALAKGVSADVLMAYTLDVAQYYHRRARSSVVDDDRRKADFDTATTLYRQWMARFPDHADSAKVHQQLADALFDAGHYGIAATEYQHLAYDKVGYAKAADAGVAAIKSQLAYLESLSATSVDGATDRESVTELRINEVRRVAELSQQFSDTFPRHEASAVALLQAARLLFDYAQYDESLALMNNEAIDVGTLSEAQRGQRDLLRAESLFSLQRYAESESLYRTLIAEGNAQDTDDRQRLSSRLAVSLYRQADSLRAEGKLEQAAQMLESAMAAGGDLALQERALFDAAALRYQLSQWAASSELLEHYRQRFPNSESQVDVDKMLAQAYGEQGNDLAAARVYVRLADRPQQPANIRFQARLKAAELYQRLGNFQLAIRHYQIFLVEAKPELDQAQVIRWQMAGMMPAAGSGKSARVRLLKTIVVADQAATQVGEEARYIAAQSNLQLAQLSARRSRSVALIAPLAKSLASKRREMEAAIAGLNQSAGYGYADVSSVALNEIGRLYVDFADAILNSERPADISSEVLAEYQLLLEEQAYPFEEKAIAAFENNLSHVRQGLWNPALQESLTSLAALVPGRYTKQLRLAGSYDVLR